jgi:hypothetical protein
MMKVKSRTDVITNSSSEVYTYVTEDGVGKIMDIIDAVLLASGSDLTAKDLVEIKPKCSRTSEVDDAYDDYIRWDVEEGETPLAKEEWLKKENERYLDDFEYPRVIYDSFEVKPLRPEADPLAKAIENNLLEIFKSDEFLC